MPAAAVIPALRAYIKVVAFKTPVVEILVRGCFLAMGGKCVEFFRRKRKKGVGGREERVVLHLSGLGEHFSEGVCCLSVHH